jgi:hypothetical protein
VAGIAFLFLGAAVAALAIAARAWGWLWPASVALGVGVLYLTHAAGGERLREAVPRAFGKRADGTQRIVAWLPWGPYLAYTWLLHELAKRVTREPAANEVAPGLWVGRRPKAHELPANCRLVVDLCAELPAARGVPSAPERGYLCLAALDASAPTPRQIDLAVKAIQACGGAALVHCAFGHGRSATIAAAVLLHRHEARLEDVVEKLRAARPRISLTWGQKRALADYERRFLQSPNAPS